MISSAPSIARNVTALTRKTHPVPMSTIMTPATAGGHVYLKIPVNAL